MALSATRGLSQKSLFGTAATQGAAAASLRPGPSKADDAGHHRRRRLRSRTAAQVSAGDPALGQPKADEQSPGTADVRPLHGGHRGRLPTRLAARGRASSRQMGGVGCVERRAAPECPRRVLRAGGESRRARRVPTCAGRRADASTARPTGTGQTRGQAVAADRR